MLTRTRFNLCRKYTWPWSIVAIYPSPFIMEVIELRMALRCLGENDVIYKEDRLTSCQQIRST